jgi:peptidoglycan/LPS O-acetylase OafA/YrhL
MSTKSLSPTITTASDSLTDAVPLPRNPRPGPAMLRTDFPVQSQKLFAHLPFLDGLRALSIFAVMTFHSGGPIGMYLFKKGGWAGVDAFFVISGFLITAILLKEQSNSGSILLKNFYMRRALRLVPAFSLWIVVTSLIRIVSINFR